MTVYHHALVLINSSLDGVPLLPHAARMAQENGMRITIAHISTDYRALNYVSDSLQNDEVSQEVIQAKALLNELCFEFGCRSIQIRSLVSGRKHMEHGMAHGDQSAAMDSGWLCTVDAQSKRNEHFCFRG